MVTFLQRTFTSLVHTHAGRTQEKAQRRQKAARMLSALNDKGSLDECRTNWKYFGVNSRT
jgi:hypothetical protein